MRGRRRRREDEREEESVEDAAASCRVSSTERRRPSFRKTAAAITRRDRSIDRKSVGTSTRSKPRRDGSRGRRRGRACTYRATGGRAARMRRFGRRSAGAPLGTEGRKSSQPTARGTPALTNGRCRARAATPRACNAARGLGGAYASPRLKHHIAVPGAHSPLEHARASEEEVTQHLVEKKR